MPEELVKIVLVGDSGVGKTSLMYRYVANEFVAHYGATLGVDFCHRPIVVNGRQVRVQIWDTAGQERYGNGMAMMKHFFRAAHGIVLVYDVNNRSTFVRAQQHWLDRIHDWGNPNAHLMLMANKVDERNAAAAPNAVTEIEGQTFANCHSADFAQVSAKSGINVRRCFDQFVKTCLPPSPCLMMPPIPDPIAMRWGKEEPKKCKC